MVEVTDAILIPVIVGLIAVATGLGMPKKFAPLASLVLGVVGGIVYLFPSDLKLGVLMGIIMGLSSMGLYSGSKNAYREFVNKKMSR